MLHPVRTCCALAAAALLLVCAALLVPRAFGVEWGPLAWVAAMTPWFLLPTVLVVLLASVGRAWVVLTIAVGLLAVQVWWQAPLYVPDDRGTGGTALVVMNTNMLGGGADAQFLADEVRDRHVQLLAVSELTNAAVEALHRAGLDDALPYRYLAPTDDVRGTGIWSRSPLTRTRALDGFVSGQLVASVTVDGTVLTFASVHPLVPGVTDHTTWSDEQAALGRFAAGVRGPLLMAGDFNATLDQAPFRGLLAEGGLVDAVDQAGAGLSFTFPVDRLPTTVVTIDHQLVRDLPWAATSVTTVDVPRSDHRAVVVTYARR